MDQAQAAAGYDAFVLGSAIHGGDWLPEAATFLGTNINALAGRPVWLFSVGTVGDHSSALGPRMSKRMRAMTKNPPSVARYRETLRPRDHRRYAGVLRRGDWPLTSRVVFTAMGGRYGDHRNWDEIDAWAHDIARQLRPTGRPCPPTARPGR